MFPTNLFNPLFLNTFQWEGLAIQQFWLGEKISHIKRLHYSILKYKIISQVQLYVKGFNLH